MKTHAQIAVALLFVLTGIGGCDDPDSAGRYFGPPWPTPCSTTQDCPDKFECADRYGVCAARMPSGSLLTLAINPAPASSQAGDQFVDMECVNPGVLQITTTPTAVLTGTLARADSTEGFADDNAPSDGRPDVEAAIDDATAPTSSGTLIADADGTVPGLYFRHQSTRISAENGFTWTMNVLPDIDYRVTFVPDDSATPSWVWPLNVGMSGDIVLTLPATSAYLRVSGIVRRPDGESRLPLAGALVTATTGSGLMSTSTTDDRGVFSLNLARIDGAVSIRVAPGESDFVFADRTFTWEDVDTFESALPDTGFLILDVDPLPETVTVTIYVLGVVDAVSRQPMGGTRMFIHGDTGHGTLSLHRILDGSSFSTVNLPRAKYNIDVVPPGLGAGSRLKASQFSVGRRVVDLTKTEATVFAVELPQRPVITGRIVYSETGEPITGARVLFGTSTAMLQAAWTETRADILHEALSDEDGQFAVRMDPGQYAIHVEPPFGSTLAPVSWPSVVINGTENIQVALNDGYLVRGWIRSSDGEPLEKALVTFLFPTSADFLDTWGLKDSSFAPSFRRSGEATTDATGRFETILPRPDMPVGAIGAIFVPWQ